MAVGVGVAVGATTILTSTSTTTLTATPTSAAAIASTTLVVGTSGSIIRDTVAELLIRTEGQQTDSEDRHVATHWLIGKGLLVNNSAGRTEISTASTVVPQATVAGLALAVSVIATQREDGVVEIAAEALLESEHQVEIRLARAIDLATREIAAVEIESEVATWEAVLEIGVSSEMVLDTVAAVRVQAAIEVLPAWAVHGEAAWAGHAGAAWAVHVGALAERAVQAAVAVVAVVADR